MSKLSKSSFALKSKEFAATSKKFVLKYKYLIAGVTLILAATTTFIWYNYQQDKSLFNRKKAVFSDLKDTLSIADSYYIDSIEVDDISEDEEIYVAEIDEEKDDDEKELVYSKSSNSETTITTKKPVATQKNSRNFSKNVDVSDVRNIARTLKGSSISAKTIIHEVNRIVTKENNSKVTGAVIAEALSHKLPKSTKNRLIKNVEYIAVSNNVIRVKLKDASNIKLTFKTDEGKKTIKVYDGAKINIQNYSSKVIADANGFSYQHLGMLWQIKNLIIQQQNQAGTLDIKLKGKLKNIDLPTITLGNLYRKIL